MKVPKGAKKEIKEFDKYLKKTSPDLYKSIGDYSKNVRWNRNTKFIFAQSPKFWFSRLADFKEMRKRNKAASRNK